MILDPNLTAAYIVVATALAVSPGPDVLFVIASGMRHKIKGAVASALGICCGSVLHALAAALGISALIVASPIAFEALRYAGAAYLLYLGIQAMRSFFAGSRKLSSGSESAETNPWNVFQRGLITNILNPKVIVFYLALLPQFVNVGLGNVGLQIFLLGTIHNLIGVVFLIGVGLVAGRASGWISNSGFGRWMDGIAGVFFVGLALRLAIADKLEH